MMISFRKLVCLTAASFLLAAFAPTLGCAADETAPPTAADSSATEADVESSKAEDGPVAEHHHDHDDVADDHSHDPDHAGGDHGDDHGSGGGMQLKKDLAFWSLITFLIFIFVLRKFAWGPLIDGLDKREANVQGQLAQAEAARQQAEKMLKDHAEKLAAVQDEVKAIIEEAKRDAEHTKNDIITTAQREAKLTQDRAIHEIERARDQALKELFDVMSAQVANATEHVLGRSLGGDDQQRLIDEALSQFQASSN